MVTRTISFATEQCYHVYNRGVEKRDIYIDKTDYSRFLELLYVCNSEQPINLRNLHNSFGDIYQFDRGETLVAIGAFCLMPNHFHILVTPLQPNGLARFMGKVTTGYSMYFNKRYQRTGVLFQGRYRAEHANTDQYLKYLYSYIHLNPVKLLQSDWKERGIADPQAAYEYAATYAYSSLPDYLGQGREEGKILSPEPFPAYFNDTASHHDELFSWLTYKIT
jgi:putative transposase